MSHQGVRASTQISFMLLLVGLAAVTGWGCNCYGGSDYESSLVTHDKAVAAGVLGRWHDFGAQDFTASTKDLDYLRAWTQRGQAGIGLLLPQAPGASDPGTLSGDGNQIFLNFFANDQIIYFMIPLITDTVMTAELQSMLPAPSGTRWQMLVPANYDWLTQVPTQTATFENIYGSLHYEVDFHGTELCNHCEVQLTGCSTADLSFSEQIGLWTFGRQEFVHSSEMTCKTPISTYIMPEDGSGNLLPGGPLIASFGFWGGNTYTTTLSSDVGILLNLNHTRLVTDTFNLAPPASERGWNYSWTDLAGEPISQLEVGPLVSPLYMTYQPNLRLEGSGLPTCTRLQDTLHLTATLVSSPTVAATTTTLVQVMPDPSVCNLADVGIVMTTSTVALNAGEWVTYALTVTNYMTMPVNTVVTDTFSSSVALGAVSLPAGCTRSGTTVTCNLANLPAGGSVELLISVQTSQWFTGILTTRAWAEPANATDNHFYDNATEPIDVTISGGMTMRQLFLPMVKR